MPAATGHAVMTAFAVLGNHRRVNESQKYPQITDAQLYIGSHNFTDAICAFRYYSGPGCQPYDGNNPAVYAIVVKIARADALVEPLATPAEGYHLIGDIKSATPVTLAQAPDDDSPLPPFIDLGEPPSHVDIRRQPHIVIMGMATKCNRDNGTFRVDIEQWTSSLKSPGNTTSVKIEGMKKPLPKLAADAPFLCIFPNTGRFPKDKRPMPYDRRYLTVEGFVTNIILKPGSIPGESVVDYIEITIEEVCFTPGAAAGPGGAIPNTLDSPSSTPARPKGRFINYGKPKNTPGCTTPSTPIASSTRTNTPFTPSISGCTFGPASDQAESSRSQLKRAREDDEPEVIPTAGTVLVHRRLQIPIPGSAN